MRESLLPVYERELRYIRRLASEFAERYPAVAGRLLLEPDKCEDPHVERLIESVAMLTARVQSRIDEEFPEITDAFLSVLAPHTLAPVPSMTIVQCTMDAEQGKSGRGILIERGALLHSKAVDGVRCRFATTSPFTLWPIRVESAEVISLNEREPGVPRGARAAIRLRLRTAGGLSFSKLALDELSFFLDGDSVLAHQTYETIFRSSLGVLLRTEAAAHDPLAPHVALDGTHLVPGGLRVEESLLPIPEPSARGLLLLQEYFVFPDKFLFAHVTALNAALKSFETEEMDLLILVDHYPSELVGKLSPNGFKLGCVPAINLFPLECEPATLQHHEVEVAVTPDAHAPYSFEVHSILEVSSTSAKHGVIEFRPFYALEHGDPDVSAVAFYHAVRHRALRKDDSGTDVALILVDRRFDPRETLGDEVLSVRALCSNRDLATELPFGDPAGDLRLEGKPGISTIRCLRKPTPPIRAAQRKDARWRLLSTLSLNHLSLVDSMEAGEGFRGLPGEDAGTPALQTLREILKICDPADSAIVRQRISGLAGIRSRRVLRRVSEGAWITPARGWEVTLTLDEEKFAGSSAFLFGTLLEQFLGLYASINSFVEVVLISRQREGVLKRWPPRAGRKQLL